jgi:hypothetical protein
LPFESELTNTPVNGWYFTEVTDPSCPTNFPYLFPVSIFQYIKLPSYVPATICLSFGV